MFILGGSKKQLDPVRKVIRPCAVCRTNTEHIEVAGSSTVSVYFIPIYKSKTKIRYRCTQCSCERDPSPSESANTECVSIYFAELQKAGHSLITHQEAQSKICWIVDNLPSDKQDSALQEQIKILQSHLALISRIRVAGHLSGLTENLSLMDEAFCGASIEMAMAAIAGDLEAFKVAGGKSIKLWDNIEDIGMQI